MNSIMENSFSSVITILCFHFVLVQVFGTRNSELQDEIVKNNDKDIIFVILNQDDIFHKQKALELKKQLQEDGRENNNDIGVIIASEELGDDSYWTYFPLPEKLLERKEKSDWYVFVEEFCVVDVPRLHQFLVKKDHLKDYYLGKGLYDASSTIIHHFDSINPKDRFYYPDPRTSTIISFGLLKRFGEGWKNFTIANDFSIDASYEFSKFLLKNFGVKLVNTEEICVQRTHNCFVWTSPIHKCNNEKKESTMKTLQHLHFAVKSCKLYAEERLPIIKETWLSQVPNFGIYTDREDIAPDRISLSVPNTERGHCSKTLEIIHYTAKLDDMKWLVIADDDTLLSVRRLASLLECYSSSDMIALGEKYGYKSASGGGFDYLTGGAAMVLSNKLVNFLFNSRVCECPSDDTPDDMFLGACFKKHQIPIIHSRRFHQGRPDDYPRDLLEQTDPISFHKFWMMNPREVFNTWLYVSNNSSFTPSSGHVEL